MFFTHCTGPGAIKTFVQERGAPWEEEPSSRLLSGPGADRGCPSIKRRGRTKAVDATIDASGQEARRQEARRRHDQEARCQAAGTFQQLRLSSRLLTSVDETQKTYAEFALTAVTTINDPNGASRAAISAYIKTEFGKDDKTSLRKALKVLVERKALTQTGQRFRLYEEVLRRNRVHMPTQSVGRLGRSLACTIYPCVRACVRACARACCVRACVFGCELKKRERARQELNEEIDRLDWGAGIYGPGWVKDEIKRLKRQLLEV